MLEMSGHYEVLESIRHENRNLAWTLGKCFEIAGGTWEDMRGYSSSDITDLSLSAVKELAKKYEDLLEKTNVRVLTCVYCGHEYPQDTPACGDEVLTEHIKICEKHPIREAEEKLRIVGEALKALYEEYAEYIRANNLSYNKTMSNAHHAIALFENREYR